MTAERIDRRLLSGIAIALIVGLTIGFVAGTWAAKTDVQAEQVPQDALHAKKWRVVDSWSGSGTKTLDTFEVRSPAWRIRWQSPDHHFVGITAFDGGAEVVGMTGDETAGGIAEFVSEQEPPRIMYLEVSSKGHWAITVEDLAQPEDT